MDFGLYSDCGVVKAIAFAFSTDQAYSRHSDPFGMLYGVRSRIYDRHAFYVFIQFLFHAGFMDAISDVWYGTYRVLCRRFVF